MNPQTQLAARLIAQHGPLLSRAVARQIRQVVPRYRLVDDTALERNIGTLMRGIQRLLDTDDDSGLISLVKDTAQMRTMAGFDGADMVMAGMCFLTVIRRALLERVQPLQEALRTYDAVEAVAIPFFGRLSRLFQSMGQDALVTATDEDVRSLLGSRPDPMEFEEFAFPKP
jgi:hypothetical protein